MRRTLSAFLLSALVVGGSPASARLVSAGHETSWGKAGVSLEDYWIESAQCGHLAANVDLTGTDPAKALVRASRMIENPISVEDAQRAMEFADPERQWNRAADIMQRTLDNCLIEHGYVKFRLTEDQAEELEKFNKGSLERRQYLHSLASDPAVLTAQAVMDS